MTLRERLVKNNDFMAIYEKWLNTSARWKTYWFEAFCEVRDKCKKLVNSLFTVRIQQKGIYKKRNYDITLGEKVLEEDFKSKGSEKVYLFRFFNKEKELVCSKVGTTTRSVEKRLKEELKSNTYTKMGCESAIVDRIYDCGSIPAEGLESLIRAEYIKKCPIHFKKNDRFLGITFNLESCDKLVENYLS